MVSLVRHPLKGEAMPVRFLFLFLYLAYALSSGSSGARLNAFADPSSMSRIQSKTGGGLDPLGKTPPPPPPPTIETGGGLDPLG